MTDGQAAIKLAVELLHMPSRVRYERSRPLPPDLMPLLLVAAGDPEATESAARVLERPPELLGEAARFYIEQILLAPDADFYRMLGTAPTATAAELRRNMALLLRSLHPDVEHDGRAVFAQRITAAWEQLKTPERRAAYDDERGRRGVKRKRGRSGSRPHKRQASRGGWRRALAAALGIAKR